MSYAGKKHKKKAELIKNSDDKSLMKEEKEVAKYLKFKCQTRTATLIGNKVEYFIGSKAIDCILDSKYAKNSPILFENRISCIDYLQTLLNKECFHRALKIYKDEEKINDEDKSKRKFKLEVHDRQIFLDSNDAYVWIYDPPTMKSIVMGSLLVFGAILGCLYPIWPPIIHHYMYNISIFASVLLGILFGLAVLKYILFTFILIVTCGKVKFWLLPNLTEDVSVLESFMPLYKFEKSNNDSEKLKKQ